MYLVSGKLTKLTIVKIQKFEEFPSFLCTYVMSGKTYSRGKLFKEIRHFNFWSKIDM